MRFRSTLCALLMVAAGHASAVAPAIVDAVQAPAWVDRDGRSLPLAPGMELTNGDVVRTGPGARAYLRLAEGSAVKLGEAGRYTLYSRSLDPRRLFHGALDVATGAFRFTTGFFSRGKARRDVTIRVATATVGIRGTDVWGKADAERDLVALIEGHIELTRAGQSLDLVPMSFMDAPRGGTAQINPLAPDVLKRLARETDIEAGDGAVRRGGPWQLAVGELADQEAALAMYDQLAAAGFAARIRPIGDAVSGWRYRLAVVGYPNEAEAKAAAGRVAAAAGVAVTPRR